MSSLPKITAGNIITACVIIATIAIAWGNIDARVGTVERDVAEVKTEHDELVREVKTSFKEFNTSVNKLNVTVGKFDATFKLYHKDMVTISNRGSLPEPPLIVPADSPEFPLTLTKIASQAGRTPDTVVRWLNEGKVAIPKRKTSSGEYRFSYDDALTLQEYARQLDTVHIGGG